MSSTNGARVVMMTRVDGSGGCGAEGRRNTTAKKKTCNARGV